MCSKYLLQCSSQPARFGDVNLLAAAWSWHVLSQTRPSTQATCAAGHQQPAPFLHMHGKQLHDAGTAVLADPSCRLPAQQGTSRQPLAKQTAEVQQLASVFPLSMHDKQLHAAETAVLLTQRIMQVASTAGHQPAAAQPAAWSRHHR